MQPHLNDVNERVPDKRSCPHNLVLWFPNGHHPMFPGPSDRSGVSLPDWRRIPWILQRSHRPEHGGSVVLRLPFRLQKLRREQGLRRPRPRPRAHRTTGQRTELRLSYVGGPGVLSKGKQPVEWGSLLSTKGQTARTHGWPPWQDARPGSALRQSCAPVVKCEVRGCCLRYRGACPMAK